MIVEMQVPTDWYMAADGLRPLNTTRWVLLNLHPDGSVTWDPQRSTLKAKPDQVVESE